TRCDGLDARLVGDDALSAYRESARPAETGSVELCDAASRRTHRDTPGLGDEDPPARERVCDERRHVGCLTRTGRRRDDDSALGERTLDLVVERRDDEPRADAGEIESVHLSILACATIEL